MDTQTSSGLPRFQVLCLNGVPWFMKLFISTRTQYIHMSYAALILVYTAEEEFYFCFVFSIHKWLFVWALWRTTSWHSSLVNPTMIAGDLHSNPVFLIYLWDNAVFACVHTWGLDWEMGKWCRRWLIHSWVVSTFWPPSFSGVVDRWSTDALMVTGGCACTHTKTAKKASSVCVCRWVFCSFCCFAISFAAGFVPQRQEWSLRGCRRLFVGGTGTPGALWLEQTGPPASPRHTVMPPRHTFPLLDQMWLIPLRHVTLSGFTFCSTSSGFVLFWSVWGVLGALTPVPHVPSSPSVKKSSVLMKQKLIIWREIAHWQLRTFEYL